MLFQTTVGVFKEVHFIQLFRIENRKFCALTFRSMVDEISCFKDVKCTKNPQNLWLGSEQIMLKVDGKWGTLHVSFLLKPTIQLLRKFTLQI